MKILDARQIKELDKRTIETAVASGFTLMDRAGSGATIEILDFIYSFYPKTKIIIVLAGKGNNGGDAYVVGRELAKKGFLVSIFLFSKPENLKGDAAAHFKMLSKDIVCEFRKKINPTDFPPDAIIIDGLLGIGLSGPPSSAIASWIRAANSSGRPIVSLDVPSGLDANNGKAFTPCIKAALTISFAAPKRGLFMNDALNVSGILRFVDIGIPHKFILACKSDFETLLESEAKSMIPRHPQDSNKYSKGVVLVLGGSKKYPGAPALSASTALASGAGFVSLAIPEDCEIRKIEKAIIQLKLSSDNGHFCPASINSEMMLSFNRADAVCVGPGMTSDDGISPLIYLLWQSRKKIVFDADALNIIARKKFEKRSSVGIMTPHEGEMERLRTAYGIKEGESKFSQAIELADKTGNVVVLKGNRTVVASPNGKINLNMSGSNTLASAGTGDVLAGLIVSLFAQGLDAFSAAILGVYLHGKAAERNGNTAFSADKLVELLRV